jgi:hypothetical protein
VSNSPVPGAQVVSRIAGLLRLVGRGADGMPLSALVNESGLTRPTVHRLLSSLASEGLLDHDPGSGNWVLGPEIFLMGSVASARFPLEDVARPSLRRLAEATGESAFFSIRRGAETVCLLREEGSFPVRSFVLHEGVRFPLGVASAGTAIMAFLPEVRAGGAAARLGRTRGSVLGRPSGGARPGQPRGNQAEGLLGKSRAGAGGQLGDGGSSVRSVRPAGLGPVVDRHRTAVQSGAAGRAGKPPHGRGAPHHPAAGRRRERQPRPLSLPGFPGHFRRRAALLVRRAVVPSERWGISAPEGQALQRAKQGWTKARRGAPPDPGPSTRCQKW